MLILCGLNENLCYRNEDLPVGPNGETNDNFVKLKNRYIFVRPGACDFIKRIQSHPRAFFGFLSFMKMINVEELVGVFTQMDPGLQPHLFKNFDKNYCSMFDDYPLYKPLQKDHWDALRDLNKVMADDFCMENEIDLDRICVIESDERKL